MRSAASPAATTPSRALRRSRLEALGLAAALAAAVCLSARFHGAFYTTTWGPLGLVVAAAAAGLLLAGRRPARAVAVAAGALVALGVWSAISPAWGGVPAEAWSALDRSLLAAAAVLVGSLLPSGRDRSRVVAAAVLAGLAAHAVEILVRLAVDGGGDWFAGRWLEGPVGYKNAQAGLAAAGVPLAFWAVGSGRLLARLAGGACIAAFLGVVLLTQSRGALIVLPIAVALQIGVARSLRLYVFAFPAVGAAALLGLALRDVDAALVSGSLAERDEALRGYVGWALLAAGVLALAAWPALTSQRARRGLAVMFTALAAVALVAGLVAATSSVGRAAEILSDLGSDADPSASAAGETRLVSLSSNGRQEAWRVAALMAGRDPLTGAGQGRFATEWSVEREVDLVIRQPHSLELELLSELGVVGLGAFSVFVGAAGIAAARSPSRPLAAAALAVLVVAVLQSAADWTWSFSALVFAVLLVVGAAGGGRPPVRLRVGTRVATSVAALAVLAAFAGPWLSARAIDEAESLRENDPTEAYRKAQAAERLNPWDPESLDVQGSIAEALGDYALAAERYREAASLSSQGWAYEFRRAGALAAAGDEAGARASCRRAIVANPVDRNLLSGPCAYDVAGNVWPVETAAPAGERPPWAEGLTFAVDQGCGGCRLTFAGERLEATIQGGAAPLDTAYGEADLGEDAEGRLTVTASIAIPEGQALTGNLLVLQVRDRRGVLLLDLFVTPERRLGVFSPTGGLFAEAVHETTPAGLAADGSPARVEVSLADGGELTLAVDGIEALRFAGADDGIARAARYVRLGVVAYDSTRIRSSAAVSHGELGLTVVAGASSP